MPTPHRWDPVCALTQLVAAPSQAPFLSGPLRGHRLRAGRHAGQLSPHAAPSPRRSHVLLSVSPHPMHALLRHSACLGTLVRDPSAPNSGSLRLEPWALQAGVEKAQCTHCTRLGSKGALRKLAVLGVTRLPFCCAHVAYFIENESTPCPRSVASLSPQFFVTTTLFLKVLLWPKSRSVQRAEESSQGRSPVPSAGLCGCGPGACVWGTSGGVAGGAAARWFKAQLSGGPHVFLFFCHSNTGQPSVLVSFHILPGVLTRTRARKRRRLSQSGLGTRQYCRRGVRRWEWPSTRRSCLCGQRGTAAATCSHSHSGPATYPA